MSTGLRRSNVKVLLLLGLDGAGTTSILYQLVLGKFLSHLPTLGSNNETFVFEDIIVDAVDVGGLDKMRMLWDRYVPKADGIFFVVDSSDEARYVASWFFALHPVVCVYLAFCH
jgi:GTPase SAR1 family protein